ncbi:DegV family protein [Paenibacillus sp. FSL W8-1187]|uniref:DegV family protein n=1 Tax=Paenibacillus pasadenensis TaxID=217090 RepID=A0A2N5N7L0_9BACL|nr:DegV family protein [Paenibacillus pasadenensis]PLT46322.1 DegV family protein [Paenibacillus pasadenensis]
MTQVRIVTDSTSDIPEEIRRELGIEMVPLQVLFGTEAFLDSITLKSEAFYDKLVEFSGLPTTSQPSPADFMAVYERLLDETPDAPILSIHLSSQFSGTYQSALLASTMLEREADIAVFDSRSASCGIGMLVIRAAQMAREGSSKDEILAEIERMRSETELYFLVDTLEYLQKGGRIGKASALIGSILNIKPILTIDPTGVITPVDKVRGSKKAIQRIVDMLREKFPPEQPVAVHFAWTHQRGSALDLQEAITSSFNVQSTSITTLGPVVGAHVGPGTVAVFMHRK